MCAIVDPERSLPPLSKSLAFDAELADIKQMMQLLRERIDRAEAELEVEQTVERPEHLIVVEGGGDA